MSSSITVSQAKAIARSLEEFMADGAAPSHSQVLGVVAKALGARSWQAFAKTAPAASPARKSARPFPAPVGAALNSYQRAALRSYADGDFAHLAAIADAQGYEAFAEAVDEAGDSLLRFIMVELADSEDCTGIDEAISRMNSARDDLDLVLESLEDLEDSRADAGAETLPGTPVFAPAEVVLDTTVRVHDPAILEEYAIQRYRACWRDEEWRPKDIGEALYEALLASNENPGPDELGFEFVDDEVSVSLTSSPT